MASTCRWCANGIGLQVGERGYGMMVRTSNMTQFVTRPQSCPLLTDRAGQARVAKLVREMQPNRIVHKAALCGKRGQVGNIQIAGGHKLCFAISRRFECTEADCA